jgi:nucleoside phosphorylase
LKILLVDDLQPKIGKVVALLVERCKLPRENILVAQTATEARRILLDCHVDLFILDVVLPLRPEDAPSTDVSVHLLEDVIEGDSYKKPDFILGLTAYEEAAEAVSPQFKEHLWAVIQFDESSNSWSNPIYNCVEYIKRRKQQPSEREYGVDLCIITALEDPEMRAVTRLPWNWDAATPIDDTAFVRYGKLNSNGNTYSVAASVASRMGMISTALLASRLINTVRPRFLAMTGVCAGVKEKTLLGDIIFCDPTWDWQSGKRVRDKENTQFSIAPHQLPAKEFLRARAQQLAADSGLWSKVRDEWPNPPTSHLRLLLGPMASGSAVLADGQVVNEIRAQERNLLGVEMECYGLFAAAASAPHPRPTPLAFKSVCDFADPDKKDDIQAYASYTSASALRYFFERYLSDILLLH